MTINADTLEQIFQMMQPVDFIGNKSVTVGTKSTTNVVKNILDIIYNAGASGATPLIKMVSAFDDVMLQTTEDDKTSFKREKELF